MAAEKRPSSEGTESVERLRRERDLFLRLLSLSDTDDVAPYLSAALELLVSATGAHHGYLELYGAEQSPPLALVTHNFSGDQLSAVKARLSQGIIHDALATGRTVSTASAVDDPRYGDFASVKAQKLRAVLCAPLLLRDVSPAIAPAEAPQPSVGKIGVLYLEGRAAAGPFPEDDRRLVEVAARAIAPNAERLLWRREVSEQVDHTGEVRRRFAALEAELALGPEGSTPGQSGASTIVGRSRALADVMKQIIAAAAVPVVVLLRGESGTGKSALARLLHRASPRRAGPFVEINVTTIPETLFEQELFGAEKGAHSQAASRIAGKVDAAKGGTLFLDEIGELSLVSQAKLLSFLQNKTFMRLGGVSAISADVRIVTATNSDLEEAVRNKTFRQDLYYRLNVLEIVVPPLRARAGDIGFIAAELAERIAEDPAQRLPLERSAIMALENAEWPGNVRQLENTISRGWAAALSDGAHTIQARHLFPEQRAITPAVTSPRSVSSLAALGAAQPYQAATRQFQAKLLEETLSSCDWNVSEAARRLELSRSHLNELIRGFGLNRASRPDKSPRAKP